MAQTTEKQLAAQKRAEARRAKKQARRENQWAQGSLLVFVLVYNLVFQLVLVPLGKAAVPTTSWAVADLIETCLAKVMLGSSPRGSAVNEPD